MSPFYLEIFGVLMIVNIIFGIRARAQRRGKALLIIAGLQLLLPILAIVSPIFSSSESTGWGMMIGTLYIELILGLTGLAMLTIAVVGHIRARAHT